MFIFAVMLIIYFPIKVMYMQNPVLEMIGNEILKTAIVQIHKSQKQKAKKKAILFSLLLRSFLMFVL